MTWQVEHLGSLFDSEVPRAQLSLGSTVLAVGGKQLQARSPGSWPRGCRNKMSRTVQAGPLCHASGLSGSQRRCHVLQKAPGKWMLTLLRFKGTVLKVKNTGGVL